MLRAFGHRVAACCDMLAVVGCCWFDQFQTRANNSQYVATYRNTVAKRTQHVARNNVATCCVGMLRSFGRGFTQSKIQQAFWRMDTTIIFRDGSELKFIRSSLILWQDVKKQNCYFGEILCFFSSYWKIIGDSRFEYEYEIAYGNVFSVLVCRLSRIIKSHTHFIPWTTLST